MGGKKVLRRMNFDAGKNTAALSATASLASAVQPVQSALTAGASQEPGAARRTNLRPLASLLPYVKRYRWRVIAALGALILAALTTLVVPIAVRRMIDFGFTARGLALIDNYFLVMIGVGAVLALASALRYYLVTTLGERIVADLRGDVFAHVTSLSAAFFDEARTGEVISRLTADTTQIKAAVGSSVSVALRNVVLFVGASVMMVVSSPRLSALRAGGDPDHRAAALRFRPRGAATFAVCAGYACRCFGLCGRTDRRRARTASLHQRAARASGGFAMPSSAPLKRRALRSAPAPSSPAIAIFLVSASVIVVLWVGAQDVLAAKMTPGRLGQFMLYAVFAAAALGSLSETGGEVAQASGAAERLFEILAIKPAIARPAQPLALPLPARGEVAFTDVRFSYPTRPNVFALDGVSFHVARGEKVAIVGPSGAGKSTIFHLLLRFYDPITGSVTLDGMRLADLDPADLRARIALVPQDSVMFASSVGDNIRFGRPDASDAEVARAAEHAHAASFIAALPAGNGNAGWRARRYALGRTAAADCDRARGAARRAAASARRGDLVARCRKRDPDRGGACRIDARAHHDRHRSSAGDGAVVRPHSGARPGPHCRAGHASNAGRGRRALCAAGEAAISNRLATEKITAASSCGESGLPEIGLTLAPLIENPCLP